MANHHIFSKSILPSFKNNFASRFTIRILKNGRRFSHLHRTGEQTKYSFGLSSYFMLPEQGMSDFEVLSRSSLFLIKSSPTFWKRMHLVGPAHVTHPWLFKNFYPESNFPWLKFVTEGSVQNKLSIRKQHTGEIDQEFRLEQMTHRHKKFDLIVLHLEDEESFVSYMQNNNIDIPLLQFSNQDPKPQDRVILSGHDLVEENLIPSWTSGEINVIKQSRLYIKTPQPVMMGMCGGPILLGDSGREKKCVGMVEALVNAIPPQKRNLQDATIQEWKQIELNAVGIHFKELKDFIDSIERDHEQNSKKIDIDF